MRKTKKLLLSRETLRNLATQVNALQGIAGGATTPVTVCPVSVCQDTCVKLCDASMTPAGCSGRIACGL